MRPLLVIFIALALVAGGLWVGSSILFAPQPPAGSIVSPDAEVTPTHVGVASLATPAVKARSTRTPEPVVVESTATAPPVEAAVA